MGTLLWRGDSLATEAGRLALPDEVVRELDEVVAALDRDPLWSPVGPPVADVVAVAIVRRFPARKDDRSSRSRA